MDAWIWVWLAVLVLSIVIEIMTEQFVCIWFAPAALASIILNLLNAGLVWQIVALSVRGLRERRQARTPVGASLQVRKARGKA